MNVALSPLLHLLACFLVAGTSVQSSRFVPGEVLVKFVDGTAAERALREAAAATPPQPERLRPLADRLADAVALPLRAKRIMSGGWLLLEVESDRLFAVAAGRLAGRERIARLEPIDEPAPGPRTAVSADGLRVVFADGSPECLAIDAKRSGGDPKAFDELVARLEAELGFAVEGEVADVGLVLRADLEQLTRRLVEDLNRLPDVEAAQPNYEVRAFGR